jgi:hypothetical protein
MSRIDFEVGGIRFRVSEDRLTDFSGTVLLLYFGRLEIVELGSEIRVVGTRCFGHLHMPPKFPSGLTPPSTSNIKSIVFPSSIEILSAECFLRCPTLAHIYFEGDSHLRVIGERAFYGCLSLPSVVLPRTLRTLSVESFCNCASLTSVLLESGSCLASIEADAFSNCQGLREIRLPASVEWIDGSAFTGSPMTKISLADGNVHFRCCRDFITDAHGQVLVLSFGLGETVRIGDEIVKIGTRCFGQTLSDLDLYEITFSFSRLSLKSVTIPPSVKILEFESFCGCGGLCSVQFESGSGLDLIGARALCYCLSLSSIVIPASVSVLSEQSFSYCMALGSVIFESQSKLSEIRSEAFSFCGNLSTISLPVSVSVQWADCFSGCRALRSVILGGGRGAMNPDSSTIDPRNTTSGFRVLQLLRAVNAHEDPRSRRRSVGFGDHRSASFFTIFSPHFAEIPGPLFSGRQIYI